MQDDLVERLRRSMVPLEWTGLGHEAADEIERLRAAGDVMAEWVAVDHSVEQCEDGCEYLIALQDWKAVRGE